MSVPTNRDVLESAIAADFDDLTAHSAYADLLIEQSDPRGEFIRVQLALENDSLASQERGDLYRQEQKLLHAHRTEWLGPLVTNLPKGDERSFVYTFRRGWLTGLSVPYLGPPICRELASCPMARNLAEIDLRALTLGGDRDAFREASRRLRGAAFCHSIRRVTLGDRELPEEYHLFDYPEDDPPTVYEWESYPTDADGLEWILPEFPNLEELRIHGDDPDFEAIFGGHWPRLRVLDLARFEGEAPLSLLARNAAMANLTTLSLWPHGRNEAVTHYEVFMELVRSPHMRKIEHLRIRFSDIADTGVWALIDAGWLTRLRTLDLRHGCVSDEGAFRLAADPNIARLKRLDLCRNMLTEEGIECLREAMRPGTFLAGDQHADLSIEPNSNYLYEEEWE